MITVKRSDIEYLGDTKTDVVGVNKFVLDPKKMTDMIHLFRVPEDREQYFISEHLAKTFQDHNLTNVFLLEVDQQEGS